MTHRAAAHLHVGDLANVPSIHRLVESACEVEHALRHASTRTRLLAAPWNSCLCVCRSPVTLRQGSGAPA